MKQYKIGDIARLLGVSTQALRFYEQEGVIVSKKSENGTRYFTATEIIQLLAFKKYQLSKFSVQQVAAHFHQGTLDSLTRQLSAQSDELVAQSEALLRRARAIRRFEYTLHEAQALEGQILCVQRPEIYLQNLTFNQLNDLSPAQREAFGAFVNAMPESSMYFICPAAGDGKPEFRFGVSGQEAQVWSLSLADAIHVPAAKCLRAHVRVKGRPWEKDHLQALLARARAAGFLPDESKPILGQHLASETIQREIYLYATIYLPIKD